MARFSLTSLCGLQGFMYLIPQHLGTQQLQDTPNPWSVKGPKMGSVHIILCSQALKRATKIHETRYSFVGMKRNCLSFHCLASIVCTIWGTSVTFCRNGAVLDTGTTWELLSVLNKVRFIPNSSLPAHSTELSRFNLGRLGAPNNHKSAWNDRDSAVLSYKTEYLRIATI
jgi:hypothetical protein